MASFVSLKAKSFVMSEIDMIGSVAQWITRLTTNQEIAGSSPARIGFFFDTSFLMRCAADFNYFFS